jgi:hypothetical protein
MSKIRIYGDTSGYVDLSAPAVADNRNIDIAGALDSKLDLAGGKILQIVRATDTTNRSTTSTSFVDVTGMSVTITPQKNDSAIIIIGTGRLDPDGTYVGFVRLTDSSDNLISGAEDAAYYGTQLFDSFVLIGYATPATTSATTYKMRFRVANAAGTFEIENGSMTGQMYAIEVSA